MVNPNLWGPHGWKFIHYTALGYPDEPTLQEKNNYKFFYNNLRNTLPCLKCRVHYAENIKNNPIDNHLNSKIDLFKWTVDIHNITNKDNVTISENILLITVIITRSKSRYSSPIYIMANKIVNIDKRNKFFLFLRSKL